MPSGPHTLIKDGKTRTFKPPFASLGEFLKTASQRYGQKPAIIFEDLDDGQTTQISYRQLAATTARLATWLRGYWKLRVGERFAYSFPNAPEVILLNLAAWRSGLVSVPLDTVRDTTERQINKLTRTRCRLLLTRPKAHKDEDRIKSALPDLTVYQIADLPDLLRASQTEKAAHPVSDRTLPQALDRDCLILFTSGTTAEPKGVRLSLRNLFANAAAIANWLRFDRNDRFHVLLPLHHINSVTFTNTTLLSGATLILGSRYSKTRFWEVLAKHRATGASIVPTIAFDQLSETAAFGKLRTKLRQVRRIQIGSAPVKPQVVQEFVRHYHIPLIQGYGQTETALRSTGVPMDLTPPQMQHIVRRNSLGTELATTNVTVLDSRGREVDEGEVGEICVRGPAVIQGYLDDPQANREAFAFGWFHSGDTGYWKRLSGRRFFFLQGRTKEIIKKGAVLISPLAIENALLREYPQLSEVYAVGFPDERLGEEIGLIATISERKVIEKILSDARAGRIKNLRKFEYPRAAILVDPQDLPQTATGKVQRVILKKRFASKLLMKSRTIAQTADRIFRLLGPQEVGLLRQAVRINNRRFGKNLPATLREFTSRAQNGVLIGALTKSGKLLGTVSALRINQENLEAIGKPGHWVSTWDGATAHGTLATADHRGQILLCVAIATLPGKSDRPPASRRTDRQPRLTHRALRNYLASNCDPVIRFHRQPKAGFSRGARLRTVIPGGRPADNDALGFNLLMEYPRLTQQPTINPDATVGTQLIEAAMRVASDSQLRKVAVYTRPAHLSRYFRVSP